MHRLTADDAFLEGSVPSGALFYPFLAFKNQTAGCALSPDGCAIGYDGRFINDRI